MTIPPDVIERLAQEPCRCRRTYFDGLGNGFQEIACSPCLAREIKSKTERAERLERDVDEIIRAWRGGFASRTYLLLEDLCDGNKARRALGEEK